VIAPQPAKSRAAIGGVITTDLAMLLVVLIWGANFSIVKIALAQIPPLAFVALRFGIASVSLALLLRLREGPMRLPPGSLWKLVWLGVIGNTVYQVLFILGLSMTTAANSALILATTPVMVAMMGGLLGLERVTRHVALGIALALCGITLVMASRGLTLSRQTLRGDLLVLAGVVCWTVYILGIRALGSGFSTLRITTLTMLTGTPGLLLVGSHQILSLGWGQIGFGAWLGLAYSSLLALVLSYVLYNSSIRLVGGSKTAIYSCVTPVVAVLVAWPMLGERPVPLQGVGTLLIIGGVLLTRRA